MNIYFALWIFIFGSLLQLQFTISSTDSSILNLIVENSTDTNFDKQSKTDYHNSSDSYSSNSVNTGPLHSIQINDDECKNGDCERNVYTSLSMDNSSTASKILWNLVSTVKSVNNQSSVSDGTNADEGVTIVPLNNAVNTHSLDHSNAHNSSFYSSDNELDSKINFDNDVLDIEHSSEVINNSSSIHTQLDFNFTTTSSESVGEAIENEAEKLDLPEGNSSLVWKETNIYSEAITPESNTLNALNVIEYTTAPDISETTVYGTDEELDVTSYVLNSFDTNVTAFDNGTNNQSHASENLTTEVPYNETDDSLNYEYNESSTLFSVNNDMTAESEMFRLKDTELVNITNSESYTASYGDSSAPLITENENSTLVSLNYDTPLEYENDASVYMTDLGWNTPVSHSISTPTVKTSTPTSIVEVSTSASIVETSTSVPIVRTLIDGNLWLMSDEIFNSTPDTTISDSEFSVDTELSKNESDIGPVFTASEKHNISSESDLLYSEISRNISSTVSMPTDISAETVEMTDHASYLPQETQMSTSHIDLFHTTQNSSTLLNNSSERSMNSDLWNEATTNSSLESTEVTYFDLSEEVKISNEVVSTAMQDSLTTPLTHSDDSTESPVGRINTIVSHDLPVSEIIKQNATLFASSIETEFTDKRKITTASNEEHISSSVMPNTDQNINVVHVYNIPVSSTQMSYHLSDLNEPDNLSTQTDHGTISSDVRSEKTSAVFSMATESSSSTIYPLKENNKEVETSITTQGSDKFSVSTESNTGTEAIATSEILNEILTSTEHFENESNISNENTDTVSISTGREGESDLITADNSGQVINHTERTPLGILTANTDNAIQVDKTKVFSSSTTESVLTSEDISVSMNSIPSSSESVNFSTAIFHYPKQISDQTEKDTETTSNEKETMKENTFSESDTTDTKNFDTLSTISGTEVSTSSNSLEVSSLGVTETHREGKHIPFSSTLVKSTTEYPRIFNVTVKTFSQLPEPKATENNFVNLLYNQVKAEELSPEERSNLINAVVKLPDNSYSKEMLNEKIAIIHLWLLHAIADEYKNATLNLSGSSDRQIDEIEFENLPQILYVLPTPEIYLPNISFTFVVHNKWRNETFPVDLILTILNLHTEDLKHLVEIEEIHFSHGLLIQKHDLLSVIIEKYGIILLSTCLITVAMILLLICVVIYYRRKTRHSAHCLTDDKLHRNMQEAMGIDLNPAVVILQDEIREKAALNGNKICNLDDDEGWLAPIGDVPVGEDNNAPFVQDTKL